MNYSPIYLGINIDHVATLRQARGTRYPDPVYAAQIAEQAGADLITLHLREDRRHIQERDVRILRDVLNTRMNLEMAVTEAMLDFACEIRPQDVCLVPESREELTTEGGLDVITHHAKLANALERLAAQGSKVSLFIDPDVAQITVAAEMGAPVIEIHTGRYADALTPHQQTAEFARIKEAVEYGAGLGLQINAGHGLHYHNVAAVAALPQICELNIGHAVVAQAVFSGFAEAVREIKRVMLEARLLASH